MERIALTIHCNKEAAASFPSMLVEAGMEFEERELLLKSWPAAHAGNIIELLNAGAPYVASLAAVLIAWLRATSKRHAHIIVEGDKVVAITHGMSAQDASKIIEVARDISLTEVSERNDT